MQTLTELLNTSVPYDARTTFEAMHWLWFASTMFFVFSLAMFYIHVLKHVVVLLMFVPMGFIAFYLLTQLYVEDAYLAPTYGRMALFLSLSALNILPSIVIGILIRLKNMPAD